MDKRTITSTSDKSATIDDIELRKTKTTRLVFRPLIIDNRNDPEASVKGWFVFQKKKPTGNWIDYDNYPLSKLRDGEWVIRT